MSGTLYTISAPSGAGKTSLVNKLLSQCNNAQVSISHTTRAMRPGEENGVNYHFVDQASFKAMLAEQQFLEHAEVFDNYYGTHKQWVADTLAQDIDVILEIDWQGAEQIRKLHPETISIFILPPSRDSLLQRLTNRGQDDEATINKRMDAAISEMSHYPIADYIVINDDFDQACFELHSIIQSQRLHISKQAPRHSDLLKDLLS